MILVALKANGEVKEDLRKSMVDCGAMEGAMYRERQSIEKRRAARDHKCLKL